MNDDSEKTGARILTFRIPDSATVEADEPPGSVIDLDDEAGVRQTLIRAYGKVEVYARLLADSLEMVLSLPNVQVANADFAEFLIKHARIDIAAAENICTELKALDQRR